MGAIRIGSRRSMALGFGLVCAVTPGLAFAQTSSYSADRVRGRDSAASRFGEFARESFSRFDDSGFRSMSEPSAGSFGGGTAWGPAPAIGSLSSNPYEDAAREASRDRSSPSRVALCAKKAVRENAVIIGVTAINCIGAVKSPKKAEKCLDGLKASGVSLGASFASCIGDSDADD